jgi:hypothetical protein
VKYKRKSTDKLSSGLCKENFKFLALKLQNATQATHNMRNKASFFVNFGGILKVIMFSVVFFWQIFSASGVIKRNHWSTILYNTLCGKTTKKLLYLPEKKIALRVR